MDNADITDEREQAIQKAKLEEIHREATKHVFFTGFCFECGEPVEPGRRWCCVECRNAWQEKNE